MLSDRIPALGIRFDIDKAGSGYYGYECWKVLWRAVDVEILSAASLFEGDTDATLRGRERVYCIAVQSIDSSIFDQIRTALEQSTEFQNIAASPKFVEHDQVVREPLLDAGRVDSGGNLVGEASTSRAALGAVRKEKQQVAQVGKSSAPIPERKKPASTRTANLPSISSLKELEDFLLTNFGEKSKYWFWLTPEELCDIVERYADMLQIQWNEASSGLSEDMAYVTLFHKGKTGKNIALYGLFPFATVSEAKRFCYDKSANPEGLFGKLEGLYGIQGRFATNFQGKDGNWVRDGEYKKERDIDVFDLWPRICRRREALGIAPNSEPNTQAKKWWRFWK